MPSANEPTGRVFTGARALFTIDGRKVGYATGCSGGDEIAYEALNVLDNVQVAEHVPVGYTASFRASRARVVNRSVHSTEQPFMPNASVSPQVHLRNIIDKPVMTARFTDQITGVPVGTMTGVRLASRSIDIGARSISGEDLVFVAIAFFDEDNQP